MTTTSVAAFRYPRLLYIEELQKIRDLNDYAVLENVFTIKKHLEEVSITETALNALIFYTSMRLFRKTFALFVQVWENEKCAESFIIINIVFT
jgi:hypothetical protein